MKESQLENKTAIATNDYVRMVDENGNSVKIKKDSFMAAIRDAFPSIISDGETGGGSVLSIIDGALKTRTDANLASVLGAFRYIGDITSATNESDLVFGYYRFSFGANGAPSWWYGSSSDNGVLFCIKNSSSFYTLIVISSTSKMQIKQVYWATTISWKSITMA